MSITNELFKFIQQGGYAFMIPLIIMSILSLAVILERIFALREKKIIPPDFEENIVKFSKKNKLDRSLKSKSLIEIIINRALVDYKNDDQNNSLEKCLEMNEHQDKDRIIKLAAELDKDLEKQDVDKLISYFSEDCEIEILGLKLKGIIDLKKWLNWFFNLFDTIIFEPIVIMVEKNIFFEEFIIHVTYNQDKKLSVKIAEVLEYKNYKIKSLRLYLDRLDFADILTSGFLSKKIVKLIKKRSFKGLV